MEGMLKYSLLYLASLKKLGFFKITRQRFSLPWYLSSINQKYQGPNEVFPKQPFSLQF